MGTLVNVLAILAGATIGVLLGNRLPEKISRTLTDAMGLVVLVIGALNLFSLQNSEFVVAVTYAPVPSFRKFQKLAQVHPFPWLAVPQAGTVRSFTAWRKGLGG